MSTCVRRASAVSAASVLGGVFGYLAADLGIRMYDRPDFVAVIPLGLGGGLLGALLGLAWRRSGGARLAVYCFTGAFLITQGANYALGGAYPAFSLALMGFQLAVYSGLVIGAISGK
ncbi:hypothetical protein [Actinomadura verrucosospora]